MALTGIISTQLLYKQFIQNSHIKPKSINSKKLSIINIQTNLEKPQIQKIQE
jgi:hypothetical protein